MTISISLCRNVNGNINWNVDFSNLEWAKLKVLVKIFYFFCGRKWSSSFCWGTSLRKSWLQIVQVFLLCNLQLNLNPFKHTHAHVCVYIYICTFFNGYSLFWKELSNYKFGGKKDRKMKRNVIVQKTIFSWGMKNNSMCSIIQIIYKGGGGTCQSCAT